MTDEQEIAWTATPKRAPVLDSSGNKIGHVDSVLGDEDKDIFHGMAVNLRGFAGVVEVAANRITSITTVAVHTDLADDEASSLEPPS